MSTRVNRQVFAQRRVGWNLVWALVAALGLTAGSCTGGDNGNAQPGTPPDNQTGPEDNNPPATNESTGFGTASIHGSIAYTGAVPPARPINFGDDPVCSAAHSSEVLSETLIVNDGKVKNAVVYIKSGIGGKYDAPTDPVVLDQHGCMYVPHVFALVAGQTLLIRNSDNTMHNIHSQAKKNPQFNEGMPQQGQEIPFNNQRNFEVGFKVKCDVHPWMSTYGSVFKHPFFAISGDDGSYSIGLLPAGTYTIEVWHESLKTSSQEITVADGEQKQHDVTLTR